MKWLKDFQSKSRNQKVIIIVTMAVLAALFLADKTVLGGRLAEILTVVNLVLVTTFLSILFFMAGVAVMKALFHVAAGLSLLIFLAQSFCAVPHAAIANEALKGLLALGLIYISYDFARILHKGLMEYPSSLESIKWSWDKIAIIVLMVTFAGIFVYEIYIVMSPIISDLCVYK